MPTRLVILDESDLAALLDGKFVDTGLREDKTQLRIQIATDASIARGERPLAQAGKSSQ